MKKVALLVLVLAVCSMAQSTSWGKNMVWDKWTLKQAGYTSATWDSVKSDSVWSEPFLTWDYMTARLWIIEDSVRVIAKYYSGPDTARTRMAFGKALEWDQYTDCDSTNVSGIGYYNANITETAIPVHIWGRLLFKAVAPGVRVKSADSLFAVDMTGRK